MVGYMSEEINKLPCKGNHVYETFRDFKPPHCICGKFKPNDPIKLFLVLKDFDGYEDESYTWVFCDCFTDKSDAEKLKKDLEEQRDKGIKTGPFAISYWSKLKYHIKEWEVK